MVFACNAYHIGKERCYFGAALACGLQVYAAPARVRTFKRLDLPAAWLQTLTPNKGDADIIVSVRTHSAWLCTVWPECTDTVVLLHPQAQAQAAECYAYGPAGLPLHWDVQT